jgi:hypothetical protein
MSRSEDKLFYLDQLLEGDAKDLIGGCLYMDPEDGYVEARRILDTKYGDTFKISTAYLNELLNWPSISNDDNHGLEKLSTFLIKCHNAMKGIRYLMLLDYTPNIQAIVKKLPTHLQERWAWKVHEIKKKSNSYPCFADLCEFVDTAAEVANDPAYSQNALLGQHCIGIKSTTPKTPTFSAQVNVEEDTFSANCEYCSKDHSIADCGLFLDMNLDERLELLKGKRMCFGCYGQNHISAVCTQKHKCATCGRRHPTALHDPRKCSQYHSNTSDAKEEQLESSAQISISDHSSVILEPIIPVRVRQNGCENTVTTYALLDTGSTGCFITESLRKQLNAQATPTTIHMRTMGGTKHNASALITGLTVSDINGNNVTHLPKAYSTVEIPASHHQIAQPGMLTRWPTLHKLSENIPVVSDTIEIGLLIGNNCPLAIRPLEVIATTDKGPFATRYRLGWTISGPCNKITNEENIVTCNRVLLEESASESPLQQELHSSLHEQYPKGETGDKTKEYPQATEPLTCANHTREFLDSQYIFKYTEKELDKASKEIDEEKALTHLAFNNSKLTFDPPSAAHMNTVWTHDKTSETTILAPLANEHVSHLDEEYLRTLSYVLESFLNCRHWIPLANDADDVTDLTPSYPLTLKTGFITAPPISLQREDDALTRCCTKHQLNTNLFWKRWKRKCIC